MIQRRAGIRASDPAFFVLTVAAGGLVGLAPVLLPLETSLTLVAGGLLLLTVATIRWFLPAEAERRSPLRVPERVPPATPSPAPDEVSVDEPGVLRLARGLFFLGTATVAQSSWRPALGLTVSEICFLAAFGCCLFSVLRGQSIARLPASLVAGVLIFATGGAISSLEATSPSESASEVMQAVYVMLLWVWTGAMVLRTPRHVLAAMTLWGLSAAVNGLGAIGQTAGIEAWVGPREGNRATGFSDHPNDLGAGTAVALIPCLLLATSGWDRSSLTASLRWVAVALVALGLVLSASVAALAAALVAVVLWFGLPSARVGSVAIGIAVVAALATSFIGVGDVTSPAERLEQVTSPVGSAPGAGSGSERVEIVESVWPRIREDPFVGRGLGHEDIAVKIISGRFTREQQVHGAPLAAWYEAGIFGFLGMMLVLGALVAAGWRAAAGVRTTDERRIGWSLIAAFAAFVVYALSAPLYFQQYGWLAAVMLVAWWAQLHGRAARRDAATMPPDDRSTARSG